MPSRAMQDVIDGFRERQKASAGQGILLRAVEGESGSVPHVRGLPGAVTALTSPAAFADAGHRPAPTVK